MTDLLNLFLEHLKSAPDSQIDSLTRKEIEGFSSDVSDREKYDFIVKIGKKDLFQISPFVKALCSLEKHYPRP